jgi:hypothetical protein
MPASFRSRSARRRVIGLPACALALVAAAASAAPPDQPVLELTVFVPLCDRALIDCGRGALGDPRSLQGNLYWGARYGAERYLSRLPGWRVTARREGSGPVLRETSLQRSGAPGERAVRLTLRAYAGDHIDDALADFFAAVEGRAGRIDLVVWAGHDRLMDVPAPPPPAQSSGLPSAVLACSSERYFGPALAARRSRPVALTRTLMAPEAYLLEALAASVAKHGVLDAASHREQLVVAYARYQRISMRAARSVFARIPR